MRMKISRLSLAIATTIAFTSVYLVAGRTLISAAQTADPAPPPAHHDHPAPTNLKVLPHDLTGEQVHEIMHQWAGELGTTCKTCHAVDKTKKTPDGKPVLDYADDSKEEKQTARVMFKMVEDINTNYVGKIDSSGAPVTCGTCHRGHLGPETFVPPPPAAH
jgi:cytochrome c553